MKKWWGGTLIATLAFILLLRSILLPPSLPLPPPPRPLSHPITLPGLASLLSSNISSSTILWPHLRPLLARSDALPDTRTGVLEASLAWAHLAEAAKKESFNRTEDGRKCPFVVIGERRVGVPCGFVEGSAVTVVGVANGGFEIEIRGGKVGGGAAPVVLWYRVEVGGDGGFVWQNAWDPKVGWGEEERCSGGNSSVSNRRVDGLVCCYDQVGRTKNRHNINGSGADKQQSFNRSALSSTSFPFVKQQPFTATLWAGLEGFHMTVNGKHETSFAYRERLEPWLVSEVKVGGNLDVLSFMANGLPVPEDFDLISNIKNLRAPPLSKKRLFLLVGVFSTANNFERRMALRRSWMQYDAVRSGEVAVRFFTGLHKSSQVNLELFKEAQAYDDIQLMPFVDYYSLISLKTIAICIFGTKILPAKYLMKTDDDAFVRVDEVLSSLKKSDSTNILFGDISFKSEPHRNEDSKWFVSREEWPHDSYPPWAHGPGYILSRDIAKFVVQGHRKRVLQLFKLEDVAMGIWIQEFVKSGKKVHFIDDHRFHSSNCENGYVLAHYQGPRLLLCLWEKLQNEHEATCCE